MFRPNIRPNFWKKLPNIRIRPNLILAGSAKIRFRPNLILTGSVKVRFGRTSFCRFGAPLIKVLILQRKNIEGNFRNVVVWKTFFNPQVFEGLHIFDLTCKISYSFSYDFDMMNFELGLCLFCCRRRFSGSFKKTSSHLSLHHCRFFVSVLNDDPVLDGNVLLVSQKPVATLKLAFFEFWDKIRDEYTDSTKINRPGYNIRNYVWSDRIFDSRLFMCNKIFLKKLI